MSDSRNDPMWGGYTSEHPEPLTEIVGMPPEENPNQTYRVGSDEAPSPNIRRAMQQQSTSDEPPSAPTRTSRRRGKLPSDMMPASSTVGESEEGEGESEEDESETESSEDEDTEQTS